MKESYLSVCNRGFHKVFHKYPTKNISQWLVNDTIWMGQCKAEKIIIIKNIYNKFTSSLSLRSSSLLSLSFFNSSSELCCSWTASSNSYKLNPWLSSGLGNSKTCKKDLN